MKFARERSLPLAIRGGGHNVAGSAVCDNGLVIDLAALRHVRVDPSTRLARAGGGTTWRDYDHETQAFGLASPGGAISSTGIAGLTLGGGYGYLSRLHGMACDNLVSVDLVTAAGELLTVSTETHPELFWALRGGGGNFGVATSFEYRLHPVTELFGGLIAFKVSVAPAVFRLYRREDRLAVGDEEGRLDRRAELGLRLAGWVGEGLEEIGQKFVVTWASLSETRSRVSERRGHVPTRRLPYAAGKLLGPMPEVKVLEQDPKYITTITQLRQIEQVRVEAALLPDMSSANGNGNGAAARRTLEGPSQESPESEAA